jgi:hypothetical protein
MKALFLFLALSLNLSAQAAPTERLVGALREDSSCESGFEIYTPADAQTCLVWSDLIPAEQRQHVERSGKAWAFYGESFDDSFVVASVAPLNR